jgi:heme oxygenase (biliverdin-IX-beta and delta-forming)
VTHGAIRTLLRAKTATLHARLENMVSTCCIGNTLGLERLLLIHHGAFKLLAPALERAGADLVCPGWDGRTRLEALGEDLRVLRVRPQRPLTYRPSFAKRPEIWGAIYALEGSRLGNWIILRRVMKCGTQDERRATQFLANGLEDRSTSGKFTALDGLRFNGEAFELAALGAEQVFEMYVKLAEKHAG